MRLLQIILFLIPLCAHAQFTYLLEENIPVTNSDGSTVPMPWAGGLNAAHYNTMDLDGDGKEDLVLFDRTADKVITFLNRDNRYAPAPDYESSFPSDITNWLLLRDANCDGRKDIFTGNSQGIRVYMNVTTGSLPAWELRMFYAGAGSTAKSDVLLSKGFLSMINVILQFDDLPAIVDADNDGDLDLFNVRFVGNGTVEYHRNFSMERYGTCDSLDFERQTQTWGDFTECSCGEFAFHGTECAGSGGGRTEHAGGKSLLAIDANGDSRLDLLFAEATCSNLYLLPNQGTLESPEINSASRFPAAPPASFPIYPAVFYEDLDFDGVKDLLAIPNVFTKTYVETNFGSSNWFYKNNGTTIAPNFSFVQSDFLQSSMIDVGDNAVPAFIDYDGDGDYDMFVSRNTGPTIASTVLLYKNVGTSDSPAFELTDDDMWAFSDLPYYNLKIQFADVTNDGFQDLLFTATHFQTGLTRLYVVRGKGGGVIDVGGQTIEPTEYYIAFSENVYAADVDRNGLVDLLVGRTSGSLEYWRNRADGSLGFDLAEEAFLGLGPSVLRQNLSCSIADLNGDGRAELLVGDQNGTLYVVADFREAVDMSGAITNLVFNPITTSYETRNLGGRIWPTTVNLYNSTRPVVVVGNVLGGLSILRNDEGAMLPSTPVIDVFPNPVSRTRQTVTLRMDRPGFVQTFTALGQAVTQPRYMLAHEEFNYNVSSLAAGVYILRFTIENRSFAKRVVVY